MKRQITEPNPLMIGAGYLVSLVLAPIVLPLSYLRSRGPEIKPLIPRLTKRGKIRFLERQLAIYDKEIRQQPTSVYETDYGRTRSQSMQIVRGVAQGLIRCQIIRQLIPLYEAVGRTEEAEEMRKYLQQPN